MRLLIDGDEANNNGNCADCVGGTDPQPVCRILSPARHQERHDPDSHLRPQAVPELRAVPDRYMPEPWTMPPEVQRDAGCEIGTDYPALIVDRRRAREEALERYRSGPLRAPSR